MEWRLSSFSELSPKELYDILKARAEVFVVEQRCAYLDMDGLDEASHHLVLRNERGELMAYSRLVPPKAKFEEPSIGRVLTTRESRGKGFGRLVMQESVARIEQMHPRLNIRIGAQAYLESFYNGFGFERVSDEYDEDGIPHVEMLRRNA